VAERVGLSPWNALAPLAMAAFPANHGTGFFVNDRGAFVSAHHVAGGCSRIVIETPEGVLVGRRVAGSEALDVAVVQFDATPAAHAVLPAGAPDPAPALFNEPVAVATTHRCGGLASRAGHLAWATALAAPAPGTVVIRGAAPIVSGNSGSPIADVNGILVGMLVARAREADTIGVAVPASSIAQVLREADVPFATARRTVPLATLLRPPPVDYTFPVNCLRP
jgi:serine protease Do